MKNSRHGSVICGALAILAVALSLSCATEPHLVAAAPKPAVLAPLVAQEAGLRTSLAQTAAVIVRTTEALGLQYPARLAFARDRAELLPTGMAMLDLLAGSLREYDRTEIVVAVYTDAIGSSAFNQQQAQARAAAVVAYLQSRGVAPTRLIARGVGEDAQVTAPNTPEGRDLNRRLVLTITPLSS